MAGEASPDVTRCCRVAALGRAETGKEMAGSDVDSICIEKKYAGTIGDRKHQTNSSSDLCSCVMLRRCLCYKSEALRIGGSVYCRLYATGWLLAAFSLSLKACR